MHFVQTLACTHSISLDLCSSPHHIPSPSISVFVSRCLCFLSLRLKRDGAHGLLQPCVTPQSLAAGGSSSAVCVACPAGTYYGSTGVYALYTPCRVQRGLQAVGKIALKRNDITRISAAAPPHFTSLSHLLPLPNQTSGPFFPSPMESVVVSKHYRMQLR
jgi:hypothetical protein